MLFGVHMIGTCEAFAIAERPELDAQTFFNISFKVAARIDR